MTLLNSVPFERIIANIDIPDTAYEKAADRYKDIGEWFSSPSAVSAKFFPKISSQGSFRLGTVISPLKADDEYDLDLACQLLRGYGKDTHTQQDLRTLVGGDLETYRTARKIEQAKEEKNRCWRLKYRDQLKFHMDVVPCIPVPTSRRVVLQEAMRRAGLNEAQARSIADQSVDITDRTLPNYTHISPDWRISNPDGYALWFDGRMRQARVLLESRARDARAGSIDDLPVYKWKTPLQRSIQLLKRHRDVMYANSPDSKPISAIITTLAARAYQGETDLGPALQRILSEMEGFVSPTMPRVPNPANPAEDFADKWDTPKGRRLQLEQNFRAWIAQARADFQRIGTDTNSRVIAEQVEQRFKTTVAEAGLGGLVGFPNVVSPKPVQITEPARPWSE